MKIQVKSNNCSIKGPCAICGIPDRPASPFWLFIEGDFSRPICGGCAEKNDSTLLKVVVDANAKHHQDIELAERERERIKNELLEHYAGKTASKFVQYDAFLDPGWHDDIVVPNPETGITVFSGRTTELMSTCNEVRVLISEKATKDQALRGLSEVVGVIGKEMCDRNQALYEHREQIEERDEMPF